MPRLRRKSPRRRLFFAGLSAAAPTPVQRPPVQEREPQFIKYEGSVFEPHSSEGGRYFGPFGITGIPGARVTIIGGQVDGWTAVTDREGRFTWQDYPECALDSAECRARRFRVEAAGYVTVEEGASDPHILWGPETPEYSTSEKHIPMSLEWPADPQIQRMLRELPAMSPLWLVERRERAGGAAYATGVIWTSRLEWSTMLAHEYCHAHQDWASDPDTYDVPPIDPLDDVLGTGLVGPQAYGGGTSLSVTRVLNRRFAAEIGVNHRTYPRIEVPVETGIRIRESRGSFRTDVVGAPADRSVRGAGSDLRRYRAGRASARGRRDRGAPGDVSAGRPCGAVRVGGRRLRAGVR